MLQLSEKKMRSFKHIICMTSFLLFVILMIPALAASGSLHQIQQGPGNAPFVTENFLEMTVSLLIVLMLILAMAWLFRRITRFSSGALGDFRILGGLSVGTRERVVMVQVGKKQLLLGVAPGRVTTLHVLDEQISPDNLPERQATTFAQRLGAALKQRSGK